MALQLETFFTFRMTLVPAKNDFRGKKCSFYKVSYLKVGYEGFYCSVDKKSDKSDRDQ